MGVLRVVCGGQFGSEAKGHVTGWLSKSPHVAAVVRVAGPNAGHTVLDDAGQRWSLRQIPVAAVTHPDCRLLIAAGSEIDPQVLSDELHALEQFNVRERLFVDPEATVIGVSHALAEQQLVDVIGSTGKGIGAARADRVMRKAERWSDYGHRSGIEVNTAPCASVINHSLQQGQDVIIEGTQGYGLGLHAGYYPHCTSSDCRAIDFMAMAGVAPWTDMPSRRMDGVFNHEINTEVWLVFRTYPIRVAGPSGSMYRELTWEELADRTDGYIQPERTTVTQKIRRIGEWDEMLAQQAMRANGWPSNVLRPVLTFIDYIFPELANVTDRETLDGHDRLWEYLTKVEYSLGGGEQAPLAGFTTGPDSYVPLI